MSTTITPRAGTFPEGTAVGLFKRTDVEVQRRETTPPLAARVATGKISSGAFTTETELDPDTDYVLIGFVDEVQSVKVDATGGKFLVKSGEDEYEAAFNVSTATLTEKLEEFAAIGEGNVEVTGGPGDSGGTTPYVVRYIGDLAGTDVAPLEVEDGETELTGGGSAVTITTTTQGSQAGEGGVQRSCMYRTAAA